MNKVTVGTIIRTACLLLALVNQIFTIMGISPLPIKDAEVEILISTAMTVITAIIAWWKNNSFSKEAIEGDKTMRRLKGEKNAD